MGLKLRKRKKITKILHFPKNPKKKKKDHKMPQKTNNRCEETEVLKVRGQVQHLVDIQKDHLF